jgi:hypothetical protein
LTFDISQQFAHSHIHIHCHESFMTLKRQPLRFVPPHRAQLLCPTDLPQVQTSYAAVSASQAVAYAAPDYDHSAVCTPAGDDTRIRPPRCHSPVSSRPCTSRAAVCGMPRGISDGGSSFEAAARCTCRVVGSIHLSDAGRGGRNYTIEHQTSGNRCDSSRCTVRNRAARPIYPRSSRAVLR